MTCLCGHRLTVHHTNRGRCSGELRMFIARVPPSKLEKADRQLTKKEAEVVVNEAAKKVERAPSYETAFRKMLKRGYVVMPCGCHMYHELEIP